MAHLFEAKEVAVIYSDEISRALLSVDSPYLQVIVQHFAPKQIQLSNGALDRKKLRDIIFTEPDEKIWLESFLHPLIRKKIITAHKQAKSAYVIIEIPLLYSLEDYPFIDRVLLVDAPYEVKIARITQRDGCSSKQAIAILDSQPSHDIRQRIADDVIINDGSLDILAESVCHLHKKYLQFSDS